MKMNKAEFLILTDINGESIRLRRSSIDEYRDITDESNETLTEILKTNGKTIEVTNSCNDIDEALDCEIADSVKLVAVEINWS